jgi:hypothetical protein
VSELSRRQRFQRDTGLALPSVTPQTCLVTGKRQLDRAQAAGKAAWWRKKGVRMEHYPCPSCTTWHVGTIGGHKPQRVRS